MNHGVHGAHSKNPDGSRFAPSVDSTRFASFMMPAMFAAVKAF